MIDIVFSSNYDVIYKSEKMRSKRFTSVVNDGQISIVATQSQKMQRLDHGCKSDTITLSKSCYHGGTWAPHTTIVKFDVPSKSRQGKVLEHHLQAGGSSVAHALSCE